MKRSRLPDELAKLLEGGDGRTLIEMRESEPHYTVTIETAEYDGEATTVSFANGITTWLRGREVKVGDHVTFWDGHSFAMLGGYRYGWAHNGELVEWLTPFERVARRVADLAKHDRDRRERMERDAEKRANDFAALPAPLKARIDRFAAEKPDFWLNGDYELFCCTEAARIAEHLRPRVDAGEDPEVVVREFHDGWSEHTDVVSDQHSNNTFGGACSLATRLLAGVPV